MNVRVENIPDELKALPGWVVWRRKLVTDSSGKSRWTKVPFIAKAPDRKASSTDSRTWGDFETAVREGDAGGFDGIGVMTGVSPAGMVGCDLDHVLNPETAEIKPEHAWAAEIVRELDSYTEISPGGDGLRIFVFGVLPPSGRKREMPGGAALEVYDSRRFLTVTGRRFKDSPATIAERSAEIARIHARFFPNSAQSDVTALDFPNGTGPLTEEDNTLLQSLFDGPNGTKTQALFDGDTSDYAGDQSRADLALCGRLARATSDPTQIDRIFRNSKLYRAKWDERHGRTTYGHMTIEKALSKNDDERTVERLAGLSSMEYERVRESAAKQLEIRVSVLDDLVKAARARLTPEKDKLGGSELEFPTVEPWPEPVDGSDLLNELVAEINRRVVMSPGAAEAMALWTVFSWLIDVFNTAPILAITSPTKRCGKTRAISVLTHLAYRPLAASNISPSAIYRSIEKFKPTLIIDEGDSFLRGNEDLRGILNSGHTRETAFVIRSVGDDYEPRRFSTWGAKAIALIGELPSTLQDRSIAIPMQRKPTSKRVVRTTQGLEVLRRKIARWCNDNAQALRGLEPTIPEALHDRASDNWLPLLAIAKVAGGDWPQRANEAAYSLHRESAEDDDMGVALLSAIQRAYDRRKAPSLKTTDLIATLNQDENAPRLDMDGRGHPTDPTRRLAKLLRPYDIKSRDIRFEDGVLKGYQRDDFEAAWERYVFPSATPLLEAQQRDSATIQQNQGFAGKQGKLCCAVADVSGALQEAVDGGRPGGSRSLTPTVSDCPLQTKSWQPEERCPSRRLLQPLRRRSPRRRDELDDPTLKVLRGMGGGFETAASSGEGFADSSGGSTSSGSI
jgi:hypothetical protein